MNNSNRRLNKLKRYAVSALKGAVFLGGLYILGVLFPLLVGLGLPKRSFDWRLVTYFLLVAVSLAFAVFLFRSRFFAQVRQWLKPLWLPAALAWLVLLIGMTAAGGLKGYYRYGFPFPTGLEIDYPPGESLLDAMYPLTAAMMCGIVLAHIAVKAVKRLSVTAVRLAVLLAFCCISLYAAYVGTDCTKSGNTWDDWGFLREIYIPYFHIAAFWLIPASFVAWKIIKEMFRLPPDRAAISAGVIQKKEGIGLPPNISESGSQP